MQVLKNTRQKNGNEYTPNMGIHKPVVKAEPVTPKEDK